MIHNLVNSIDFHDETFRLMSYVSGEADALIDLVMPVNLVNFSRLMILQYALLTSQYHSLPTSNFKSNVHICPIRKEEKRDSGHRPCFRRKRRRRQMHLHEQSREEKPQSQIWRYRGRTPLSKRCPQRCQSARTSIQGFN